MLCHSVPSLEVDLPDIMSASQVKLPLELQRIILENLYGEWHLCAHESESPAKSRRISIRPSSSYPVSPLLVSHEWSQYATDLLSRNFCGTLDMTATNLRNRWIVETRAAGSRVETARTSDSNHHPDMKDSSRPTSLAFDFRHLYHRITTLRVDSCSMLVAALSIFKKELPKLDMIEVVPTFKFRVYEGQLSYAQTAISSPLGPCNKEWNEAWESWFITWIGFTWSCSQRNLSSLQKHRYNIFYQQTFIFEDFDSAQLVSDVCSLDYIGELTCSSS